MNANLKKVKAIFLEALDKYAPDQWDSYLDDACGTDQQLRRSVHVLLDAHASGESLLDKGAIAVGATIDQPITERLGQMIGRYKLSKEIGEGGMGVVYVAEQTEPVRRKVAMKIIKPGMDSRHVVSRFEAERQALAMMDHTNIAKVLDAGATETGRPYFVMELVQGVPITEHCDANNLTTKERLGLFLDVCHAVQHAHHKGIIHRDIKPSNVMVAQDDGVPVPKIIDFGIAKATDRHLTERTVSTSYGQMVGTPLYMSPEQAEMSGLDIDTRSDIYSLGVLLYELLTGSTPFDGERIREVGYDEMRCIIREEDPPRPSERISTLAAAATTASTHRKTDPAKLSHLLRGELDWIVMKALEKDRKRRYETANAFARDVQRYLDDEPVEACPPSASYRLRKFARRNKSALAAALAVAMALMAGTGLATWQASRANREAEEAEQQRRISQENFERARAAVDEYLTRVSEEKLLNTPGLQPLRKDLLELALKYYQEFIKDRGGDPTLQADLAAAHFRVGRITSQIGSKEKALEAQQTALEIRERLTADNPDDPQLQNGLAKSYRALGILYSATGKLDEALASYQKACAIHQELVSQNPEIGEYRSSLAESCHGLGGIHRKTGNVDEALACYRRAIEIQQKLVDENPTVAEYRVWLAGHYYGLGLLWSRTGKLDEALNSYQRAIKIRKELADQDPTVVQYRESLGTYYNELGIVLKAQGKLDEAIASYQRAIEVGEKLTAENPAVTAYRHGLAGACCNLGILQWTTGKLDEAIDSYQRAIKIQKELVDQNPTVTQYRAWLGNHHGNLGVVLKAQGKLDEAIASYQRAIKIKEELVDQNPTVVEYQSSLASSHNNLGIALKDQGKLDEALDSYQKALEICEKLTAENPAMPRYRHGLAGTCCNLGVVHWKSGKLDEAIASYQRAIKIQKELVDQNPTVTQYRAWLGNHHNNLGTVLEAQGKLDEAIASHQRALEIKQKLAAQNPTIIEYQTSLADAYSNLGRDLRAQGKLDEAVAQYREAIRIDPEYASALNSLAWLLATSADPKWLEPRQALVHAMKAVALAPEHADHWTTLGVARYRNEEWDEAISALKKAAELESGGSATDWLFRAMAHWQLGDKDEASKWYDKAVAWMDENKPEDKELRRFRAEAAGLLEVGEPSQRNQDKESPDRKERETVEGNEPDTTTEPLPSNSKEMPQNASNDP